MYLVGTLLDNRSKEYRVEVSILFPFNSVVSSLQKPVES